MLSILKQFNTIFSESISSISSIFLQIKHTLYEQNLKQINSSDLNCYKIYLMDDLFIYK